MILDYLDILKQIMSVLKREGQREIWARHKREDIDRGKEAIWPQRENSDSAASQGVPTTTKNWKRQRMDSPQETPEGVWPCQHCECGLWPPELWEQISLVLSHPVCGHLLEQPQETNIFGFVLWFHLMMMPMYFCPYRARTPASMSSVFVCLVCHKQTP